MAAERLGICALRHLDREAQRRFVGAAAGGSAEDAGTDADADHRQAVIEEIARQPQFGAKARDKIAADDAERAGAEQDQAGKPLRRRRHQRSRRERPAVMKADIAALEMVLHQTEIFGFDMLQDEEGVHAGVRTQRNAGRGRPGTDIRFCMREKGTPA